MTREEAIEYLETIAEYYSQDHSDPYVEFESLTKDELDALHMAIKALEQEPSSSENPNKWIPVSERLPKAGEYIGYVERYYLVQNEYGDILVARYTHSRYWKQIYQLKSIGDEIVAWMPLPEPYKAESEEV